MTSPLSLARIARRRQVATGAGFWHYRCGPDIQRTCMPLHRFVATALFVLLASSLPAQEWTSFVSKEDGFSVNFRGTPQVKTISWDSEYAAVFPGKVYSVENGAYKYAITVIDYRDSERIHAARTNSTEADAPEQGLYWRIDIMASIAYAATQYRQRDAKVTYDAWHYIDLVSGHQLHLTNPDGSRTFVGIYLHENRLYILEATVPKGAPEPGLFQQSLSFVDAEGKRVRYDSIYSNRLPAETMTRQRQQ
jgi:hypothetical protein